MDSASDTLLTDALLFGNPFEGSSVQQDSNLASPYPFDFESLLEGYQNNNPSSNQGDFAPDLVNPYLVIDSSSTTTGKLYNDEFLPPYQLAESTDARSAPIVNSNSIKVEEEAHTPCSAATDSKSEDNVPASPKKRRNRKRKAQPTPAEKDAKRQKFLARNRVAATKCRAKNRQRMDYIQDKYAALETENAILQLELSNTKDEIENLRKLVMMHRECNHPNLSVETGNAQMVTEVPDGSPAILLGQNSSIEASPPASRDGGIGPTVQENLLSIHVDTELLGQDKSASGSETSANSDKQPASGDRGFQSPTDSAIDLGSPMGDKTHTMEDFKDLLTMENDEELVPDFRRFIQFGSDN